MTSSPANNPAGSINSGLAQLTQSVVILDAAGGRLADALRSKQRILIENRLTELETAANAEIATAAEFQQLERERQAAQGALAQSLGLDAASATLSSTLGALEQAGDSPELTDARRGLRSASEALADRLAELAQLNADNAHLSANMLDYTRMLLGALSNGGQQPGYGSDGKVTSGSGNELVSISV